MTKAALKKPPLAADLCETDFHAWTQGKADLLRQGRLDAPDPDFLPPEPGRLAP